MKSAAMTEKLAIRDRDVLLVVDVQNDFCPEGASRLHAATRS